MKRYAVMLSCGCRLFPDDGSPLALEIDAMFAKRRDSLGSQRCFVHGLKPLMAVINVSAGGSIEVDLDFTITSGGREA